VSMRSPRSIGLSNTDHGHPQPTQTRIPNLGISHLECEHVALVHHGTHDLSRLLAPSLHRAAAERAAVLLCLDTPAAAQLRTDLGSLCESFTFRPADSRYISPGVAMAALHDFVIDSMASGALTVWSIGAIPLNGDGRDQKWIRYEHAVLNIFAELPLRTICLYDAETTPTPIRDSVRLTHQSTTGDWVDGAECQPAQPEWVDRPQRAPDLVLHNPTPQAVRATLADRFGNGLPQQTLENLQLVASELVTNAIIHGAPPVEVSIWQYPTETELEIRDRGTMRIHPYADLRPLEGGPHGGFGLWTIGQLADSVNITRNTDGNTVTVFLSTA